MHWRCVKCVGLYTVERGNAKAYGKLAIRKVSLSNELSNERNKLQKERVLARQHRTLAPTRVKCLLLERWDPLCLDPVQRIRSHSHVHCRHKAPLLTCLTQPLCIKALSILRLDLHSCIAGHFTSRPQNPPAAFLRPDPWIIIFLMSC